MMQTVHGISSFKIDINWSLCWALDSRLTDASTWLLENHYLLVRHDFLICYHVWGGFQFWIATFLWKYWNLLRSCMVEYCSFRSGATILLDSYHFCRSNGNFRRSVILGKVYFHSEHCCLLPKPCCSVLITIC